MELAVVRAVMRGGAGDETVARWLRLAEVREARLVLLAAMAEVREGELPASWLRELRVLLGGDEVVAVAEAVTVATGAVTPPVTVAAVEIAEMRVGKASLMPQGLDRILTLGELAVVVAFLESLKCVGRGELRGVWMDCACAGAAGTD